MKKLYMFLLSFACMQSIDAASSRCKEFKSVGSAEALSRLHQAGLLRSVPFQMCVETASLVGSKILILPAF